MKKKNQNNYSNKPAQTYIPLNTLGAEKAHSKETQGLRTQELDGPESSGA